MKNSISVVIPVYNEEASIDELLTRLLNTLNSLERSYEVILVDDGSRDRSRQLLEDASQNFPGKIRAVLLNRNYGQHAAVMAGFAEAQGDIVVTLDADLQNPPEEIPKLIQKIDEGYDLVGGIRTNRHDSAFRKFASSLVNSMTRKFTGVNMSDYGCMLRAYSASIVKTMVSCSEHSTFIPVLANSFAGNPTEVEVAHAERAHDQSKYSLMKLISLQFDLLTCMTTFPLRLLSIGGSLLSMAGIGFGILLMGLRLAFGATWAADGVFTMFAVLFFFVGAQFVAMGLLGEYIGRIYMDVRGRPRYTIFKIFGESTIKMGTSSYENKSNLRQIGGIK